MIQLQNARDVKKYAKEIKKISVIRETSIPPHEKAPPRKMPHLIYELDPSPLLCQKV